MGHTYKKSMGPGNIRIVIFGFIHHTLIRTHTDTSNAKEYDGDQKSNIKKGKTKKGLESRNGASRFQCWDWYSRFCSFVFLLLVFCSICMCLSMMPLPVLLLYLSLISSRLFFPRCLYPLLFPSSSPLFHLRPLTFPCPVLPSVLTSQTSSYVVSVVCLLTPPSFLFLHHQPLLLLLFLLLLLLLLRHPSPPLLLLFRGLPRRKRPTGVCPVSCLFKILIRVPMKLFIYTCVCVILPPSSLSLSLSHHLPPSLPPTSLPLPPPALPSSPRVPASLALGQTALSTRWLHVDVRLAPWGCCCCAARVGAEGR